VSDDDDAEIARLQAECERLRGERDETNEALAACQAQGAAVSDRAEVYRGLLEEARGFIELRARFLRNRDERIFKDDIFAMEGLLSRIDAALEGGE